MSGIVVTVEIDRPPDEVWAALRDIADHVSWMADAVAIRFTSTRREGLGTTFECDTKIGPLTTTDVMEITSWEDGRRMGVRHTGVITGEGVFVLDATSVGGTRFRWEEELFFPWWFGGKLGTFAARPLLTLVWRRNLARLKARIEGDEARDSGA